MDFKKQVQHLKNPGEEGLQNMEEQCKACAMSLRDDDDDFFVMPSYAVPLAGKGKGKGSKPQPRQNRRATPASGTNVVTASMTARRVSLRSFNDLKRNLTSAIETAETVLEQAPK